MASAPTDPATSAASSTTAQPSAQTPSPARTTGTAAATSPAYRVQPRRAAPKRAVERSCIVCHRRKVRCDKTMPCANCVRSGVLCCYPSNKRAPRQPKTTIADIASRLVQLERTIVAVAGGDGGGDGQTDGGADDNGYESDTPAPVQPPAQARNTSYAHSSLGAALERRAAGRAAPASISTTIATTQGDETRSSGTPVGGAGEDDTSSARDGTQSENGAAAQEILLQNAYASRYINELLLSKILEEVRFTAHNFYRSLPKVLLTLLRKKSFGQHWLCPKRQRRKTTRTLATTPLRRQHRPLRCLAWSRAAAMSHGHHRHETSTRHCIHPNDRPCSSGMSTCTASNP